MVRGMKRLMAFFVVFTLLFQMTDMPLHAENSRDVSALLTVKEAYIEQNHKDVVENSMLTDTDPVSVSVNFKVPVLGDGLTEEDSYVRKGDTAVIELATKYKLADTASPSFALTRKVEENGGSREVKIGSLRIVTDTDANKVYAHIVFDGDDEVFDGQPIAGGGAWSNVNCKFSTTLEYNGIGDGAKPGEHAVTILGKSFSVKVPEPPVIMTMEKSGAVEGKFVSWKVKIDAQQAGAAADFGGYVFQDNLKSVGSYVDRSFKIGTAEDGSDAVEKEVSYEASLLQHTFPESAKGICYVFFKTEIPDAIYYANSEKTIRNTAVILKDKEQVSTSSASVNYDGTWIKKELNGINHKDGTISWTITANQPAASLANAVITDKLDSKLNWQSAALEIYNGTSWDAGSASFSNEPADGKYEIGTINAKVRLTITAQLKDKSEIEHTVVSVNNKATLSWEGNTGVGSNSVYSSIGFNPITKTKGAYDASAHTATWNVNVEQSDVNDDLRVLELLVYDASFTWDDAYEITDNTGTDLTTVSKEVVKSLTPSCNQRYVKDSFAKGADSAAVPTLHHIKKNGTVIADVLVVTGTDVNGLAVDKHNQSFSYKSQVTNPNIYLSNDNQSGNSVKNTAFLYSGNKLVNQANATVSCPNTILLKDALTAVDGAKDLTNADNVNKQASAADKLYNYKDGSAVFRLQVNASDLKDMTNDVTTVDGEQLGDVTVKDILPKGWEFQNITADKKFLIYEGVSANGKVTAKTLVEPDYITSDFTKAGEAAFTFSSLQKPYVILLKAGPNEQTAKGYFDKNQKISLENAASLTAEHMTAEKHVKQSIQIKSTTISKTKQRPDNGILQWKITYNPYMQKYGNALIQDTLSEGIELRMKSDGALDMDEQNIAIQELEMEADGTLKAGKPQKDTAKYIRYNPVNRTLYFTIPDEQKVYQLIYLTDITGDYQSTLSNHAILASGHTEESGVTVNDQVYRSDAQSTMQRSGWLEITKVNEKNIPLEGAEFTVFSKENDAVIRKGVTPVSGVLTIRGLPIGSYYMKETKAPDNYRLSPVVYQIEVIKEDVSVLTKINGSKNTLTLVNTQEGTSGDLKIRKELKGNDTDSDMEFKFRIQAGKLNKEVAYLGEGGKKDGTLVFTDGKAEFTLCGGQSIQLVNLPKDTDYMIEEQEYQELGYQIEKQNDKGTIKADMLQEAVFTNIRNKVLSPVYYQMNVHISLDGQKPQNGQFQFQLKDEMGVVLQTVKNDGGVIKLKELKFSSPGVYTYQITQVTNAVDTIRYDEGLYTVIITVIEKDGLLTVESVVWEKDGKFYESDTPLFSNTTSQEETPQQPIAPDESQEDATLDTEEKETLPEKEPVKTKEQQTGDKNKGAVKHEKKKATAETYDSTHMTLWLLTASVSLAVLGIIKLYGMRKKS